MSRPYDPNETADDVRASLRREHPDLTDADLDRILTGEPKRRRKGYAPDAHWGKTWRGPRDVPSGSAPSAAIGAVINSRRRKR